MEIEKECPNHKYYRATNEIEAKDGQIIKWNVIGKNRMTYREDKFGTTFKVPNNAEIYVPDEEIPDFIFVLMDWIESLGLTQKK